MSVSRVVQAALAESLVGMLIEQYRELSALMVRVHKTLTAKEHPESLSVYRACLAELQKYEEMVEKLDECSQDENMLREMEEDNANSEFDELKSIVRDGHARARNVDVLKMELNQRISTLIFKAELPGREVQGWQSLFNPPMESRPNRTRYHLRDLEPSSSPGFKK